MSASANRLTFALRVSIDCYRWCLLPVVAFLQIRWRLPGLAGSFCSGRDMEAAWPLWDVYAVRVWSGDAGRSSFCLKAARMRISFPALATLAHLECNAACRADPTRTRVVKSCAACKRTGQQDFPPDAAFRFR